MYRLVDPDPRYQRSFLDAADEFAAEGLPQYAGIPSPAAERALPRRRVHPGRARGPRRVGADGRLPARRPAARDAPPAGLGACTVLWVVDDEEYLGRISVRHRAHRPTCSPGAVTSGTASAARARGRGAATFALAAVLPRCAELGIDPALVTCDVDNETSRRTIERNGGVYEDTREGKLRYWVPTRAAALSVGRGGEEAGGALGDGDDLAGLDQHRRGPDDLRAGRLGGHRAELAARTRPAPRGLEDVAALEPLARRASARS